MIQRERFVNWVNGWLETALCAVYWTVSTFAVLSVLDILTTGIVVVIRRWTHGES